MALVFLAAAVLAASPPQAVAERLLIAQTARNFDRYASDPAKVHFRRVHAGKAEMLGGTISLVLCGQVAFDDARLPSGWKTFMSIQSNGNFSVDDANERICSSNEGLVLDSNRDLSAALKAQMSH